MIPLSQSENVLISASSGRGGGGAEKRQRNRLRGRSQNGFSYQYPSVSSQPHPVSLFSAVYRPIVFSKSEISQMCHKILDFLFLLTVILKGIGVVLDVKYVSSLF